MCQIEITFGPVALKKEELPRRVDLKARERTEWAAKKTNQDAEVTNEKIGTCIWPIGSG